LALLDPATTARRSSLVELASVLGLDETSREPSARDGDSGSIRILFDGRSLQDPNFRERGIGRVARECLNALNGHNLTLLVDPSLPPIDDADSAGHTLAAGVGHIDLSSVDLFFNPAPMVTAVAPIVAVLGDSAIRRVGVVYDFIPAEFPDTYLSTDQARVQYAARFESLRHYHDLLTDSVDAAEQTSERLGHDANLTVIGAPDLLSASDRAESPVGLPDRYLFAPLGADRRKNIPGALAVAAELRHRGVGSSKIVVLSHMHDDQRRELNAACERMRFPSEDLLVISDLSDSELRGVYRGSTLCLIPSFTEGYSIPVVEAINQGVPVVVSDIAVHKELTGKGRWMAPAEDISRLADAAEHVLENATAVLEAQKLSIADHAEPEHFRNRVAQAINAMAVSRRPEPVKQTRGPKPRLGLFTPWPPDRSGVATFNSHIMEALLDQVDVDVFTTFDVPATSSEHSRDGSLRFFRNTISAQRTADLHARVSVIGNSHFHIPILEHLRSFGGAVIAHDNRLTDLYTAWEGSEKAAELMRLDGANVTAEQLDDFLAAPLTIPNLAYGEVARLADPLFVHAPSLAERIETETGCRAHALPFCQTRLPSVLDITLDEINRARSQLGFGDDEYHLVSFGLVDRSNKGTHVIIEATAWLQQFGLNVHLHLLGGGNALEVEAMEETAARAGVLHRTNFQSWVSDEDFELHQLAADMAVQLRLGPPGQISGVVADCIAFGLPVVASSSTDRVSTRRRALRGSLS